MSIASVVRTALQRRVFCTAPRTKKYSLTARSDRGGTTCITHTASGHQLQCDLPRAIGGRDTAAEPVYHLLSALCGCEAATAAFVARQLKVKLLEPMEFELRAERDERGALSLPVTADPAVPARLTRVSGRVTLVTDATDEALELLERQTHLRCPVANLMSAGGVDLDIRFERRPAA